MRLDRQALKGLTDPADGENLLEKLQAATAAGKVQLVAPPKPATFAAAVVQAPVERSDQTMSRVFGPHVPRLSLENPQPAPFKQFGAPMLPLSPRSSRRGGKSVASLAWCLI